MRIYVKGKLVAESVHHDDPDQKLPDCHRCYNRLPFTIKVIPVRQETLCDNCKQQVKLLDYVTEEA